MPPCFLAASPAAVHNRARHSSVTRKRVRSCCRVSPSASLPGHRPPPIPGKPRQHPRPDGYEPPPPFIPQTMEFAIRQAQQATADALVSGVTRVRVELPMGRSRKHWYRMSPLSSWYSEASVHAFHFADMFRGLRVCIVLGTGPGVLHSVPWVDDLRRVKDGAPPIPNDLPTGDAGRTVVIIAAASTGQRAAVERIVEDVTSAEAVVLLNCFLDAPLKPEPNGFRTVYACRSYEKCAVLRPALEADWAVFVEIAVFEYEWVGYHSEEPVLAHEEEWTPTQRALEQFATSRGAGRKGGISGFYATEYAGCEAGFWPFMTLASREVMPMDGELMDRESRERRDKKKKNSSRPFGFF